MNRWKHAEDANLNQSTQLLTLGKPDPKNNKKLTRITQFDC